MTFSTGITRIKKSFGWVNEPVTYIVRWARTFPSAVKQAYTFTTGLLYQDIVSLKVLEIATINFTTHTSPNTLKFRVAGFL